MNLQKAFGPQISPIDADESGPCLVGSDHLPDEPWVRATSLFNLRNLRHLRIELGFLV
ncbi:MAG: hypothetical protein OEL86_10950 [Sulfuritalea sp.]|jgi:hypothetical protein|nr:hypothetical protein [Sulfuritalea sp.]